MDRQQGEAASICASELHGKCPFQLLQWLRSWQAASAHSQALQRVRPERPHHKHGLMAFDLACGADATSLSSAPWQAEDQGALHSGSARSPAFAQPHTDSLLCLNQ